VAKPGGHDYDGAVLNDEDVMKKFLIGLIVGLAVAFPLGVNFGKDVPLLSNPFAAKPDFTERVKQRTEGLLKDTKEAIHDATKPVKEQWQK
jgi:hypothetical protein